MAIGLGNDRELNITLRVQDDGSLTVEQFGQNAEREFERTGTNWKKMAKDAAVAMAGIATATAALITHQANLADQAGKTAEKLGLQTAKLTELQYAAELSGVAANTLNLGLQRMTRRVAEAATGTGEAIKALDALGLSAKELNKLSPDEQFKLIADAMQKVDNQSEKVRLAFKLFDSEGVDLVRTLSMTRKGLEESAQEARELGRVIDDQAAKQAAEFNDNLTRLQSIGIGLSNALMQNLLPVLIDVSNWMLESAKSAGALSTALDVLSVSLRALLTAGLVVSSVFETVGKSIAAVAAAVTFVAQGEFSSAWEALKAGGEDITKSWNDAADAAARFWQSSQGGSTAGPSSTNAPATGGGGTGGGATDTLIQAEIDQWDALNEIRQEQYAVEAEQRQERYDAVSQMLLSETELAALNYATQAEIVAEAMQNNLTTETEGREQLLALETAYQRKLVDIKVQSATAIQKFQAKSWANQTSIIAGNLANMTASAAREFKAFFYINKAASIANATIKGAEAIQSSFAFGAAWGGPIGGAILAGIAAAATAANIYTIAKTEFGGGSIPSQSIAAAPPVSVVPSAPTSSFGSSQSSNVGIGSSGDGSEKQIVKKVDLALPDDEEFVSVKSVRKWIRRIDEQLIEMGSDTRLLA